MSARTQILDLAERSIRLGTHIAGVVSTELEGVDGFLLQTCLPGREGHQHLTAFEPNDQSILPRYVADDVFMSREVAERELSGADVLSGKLLDSFLTVFREAAANGWFTQLEHAPAGRTAPASFKLVLISETISDEVPHPVTLTFAQYEDQSEPYLAGRWGFEGRTRFEHLRIQEVLHLITHDASDFHSMNRRGDQGSSHHNHPEDA